MIQDQSFHSALLLSEKYADNKIVLQAKEGSVLAPICRLTNPLNAEISGQAVQAYDVPELSKVRRIDGVSSHDEEMEEAVAFVSQIVRDNLRLAQTTVNPVIRRVVDNVEETLNADQRTLEQPLTIVQTNYHRIWNNPILESFVERYEESPAFEITPRRGMPVLTPEQIEEFLYQEVSRFDEDLKDLVESRPASWLTNIYTRIFRPHYGLPDSEVDAAVNDIDFMLARPSQHRDELIVAFCLARRFATGVPEGAELDLTLFRDWMATLQSQFGRAILKVYEARDRAKRNKQLVVEYPHYDMGFYKETGASIVVNSDIYETFLEEGGSPEVLMGSAVTDKQEVYSVLIEKAEYYTKAWKKQERILGSEVRFDRFNRTVAALEKSIALEINGIAELGVFGDDQDELDALRQSKHGVLKKKVRDLTAKQVDAGELYSTARWLVCCVLFPRTEALKILCAIDAAAEQNPDISVREAAFLAVIEIVTDWVGCQIDVEHH